MFVTLISITHIYLLIFFYNYNIIIMPVNILSKLRIILNFYISISHRNTFSLTFYLCSNVLLSVIYIEMGYKPPYFFNFNLIFIFLNNFNPKLFKVDSQQFIVKNGLLPSTYVRMAFYIVNQIHKGYHSLYIL